MLAPSWTNNESVAPRYLASTTLLEESFSLAAGEAKVCTCGPEFAVRFDEVIEDSRCPSSVICIWGGRVVVSLQVQGDTEGQIELAIGDTKPEFRFDTLGGHVYELIAVDPYPETSEEIPFEEYELEMRVTEL